MLDKVRKMKIGEKEYSFKMTNKTIFKVDEKYGNYGSVIYGLMQGVQYYTNAVKLISCACIEKEWNIEELIELFTSDQLNGDVPNFAAELYFDYIGIEETDKKEEDNKKEKN
ncbi:RNA polymerase subunit sigma [Clostridium sp. D2Q-11]|uniref:RNA polymerase subunit sigma n=1 Tax=Anaeromonas frigoriresistens TaxID=2683708 RepID=A0A942Z7R9_9FIRM|nr:RNA polymerase subunit sigma [Anaeromonas frigoriresistens]MBS4539826.1 RNA polymerase subunit sigma [Anaeromonas frigoriresistens]